VRADEREHVGNLLRDGDVGGKRAEQDEAQRGEDDGEDHAEGRGLLLVALLLGGGHVLGDLDEEAPADVAAPGDARDGHRDEGGRNADEDQRAEVDAERAGDEDGAG